MNRLANRVYELARSRTLQLNGFPDFEPVLAALKSGHTPDRQKSYRVSVQQQDRLIILQALAQKWMDNEITKERAAEIINDHNKDYNPDGVYWMEERSLSNTWHVKTALKFCTCNWSLAGTLPIAFFNQIWELHLLSAWRREASNESIKVEEPPQKRVKLENFSEQDISKLGNTSLNQS